MLSCKVVSRGHLGGYVSNRLQDVTVLIADCEHKTAPGAAAGEEFGYSIGTPNLRQGRILFGSAKRVDRSTYDAWTRRAVPRVGDLILAREAPVGQVGLVPDGVAVCLGQRTVLIRPDVAQVNPRYLQYRLLSPAAQQWMTDRASGSTVAHLNVEDVRDIDLGSLPSRATQDEVAELLGAVDDKIDANRRVVTVATELAIALYEDAVSTGAHLVPLGQVGRWLSGGTPKTSEPAYWGGDIPWISAASLKSFFVASSDRNVTREGAASGSRLAPPGAILFVVRGMSLKTEFRLGIAQREVAFGQDCKAILVDDAYPTATVAVGLAAARDRVLTLVDEAGHGTGRLPTDRIERLEIALPPADRTSATEECLSALLAQGASAEEETRWLVKLRHALLPPLISGELRMRDAAPLVGEAV